MKSDILGLPLEIPRIIDAELTGNLCAALVGQGRYADLAQAAEDLVRIEHVVRPDARRTALYARLMHDYRELCALYTAPGES